MNEYKTLLISNMNNNLLNQTKKCDLCRKNANCVCFECVQYFCEQCYKIIHDIKKDSQHKKESIDFFVPIDIKCPYHPKNPLNLFCINEKGKINSLFKIIYRTLLCLLHL